jgi:pimeloyl-ACP methyl ester carboxylesterase
VWEAGAPGAPAALLLHGLPTDGRLYADLRSYLSGWRLICPDLPGFGRSPAGAGPEGPADLAHRLVGMLDRGGVADAVHLVGHDYGGLLAGLIAAEGRGRSLAVCSAALRPGGWAVARLSAAPGLHRLLYRGTGGRVYHHLGTAPGRRAAFLATFGAGLAAPGIADRMRAIARRLGDPELRALPARLRDRALPTRLIWGLGDPFFPAPLAPVVAGPGRLVLLPGARHAAPWDQPRAFAAALAELWAEGGAGMGAAGQGSGGR